MKTRKTLVLGASVNPDRYSNIAVKKLREFGHPVIAIGKKPGNIHGVEIIQDKIAEKGVDTITLYLNPHHQKEYYAYILSLQPKRIIFNPGAENDELGELAAENGIKTLEACTLVMLQTGQY
jgi:predicted CoA-binding protein